VIWLSQWCILTKVTLSTGDGSAELVRLWQLIEIHLGCHIGVHSTTHSLNLSTIAKYISDTTWSLSIVVDRWVQLLAHLLGGFEVIG